MLYSPFSVLSMLFRLLELTIFIECIASWVPQFQGNKLIMLVHNFISPILEPLKKLQDKIIPGLPMDFSPIIALVILNFLKSLVFRSLI